MKPDAYYTLSNNAKYFNAMAEEVDRIRDLHSRYNVAYRLLRMYFDVNPKYTRNAEALASWRSREWAPWAGWGDTESWLILRKEIDDEILEVFGPGATLLETWRRWEYAQSNYYFIDPVGPVGSRRGNDSDVDPSDWE